ncbi:hypothetical protein GOP47_0016847 [Adiantum capillus-veneris]|uniref:Uncharacterized protein n=2 Tax=Adiantum capillus-veneris TaxID=13818 RepID=A0A9D4UJ49_ADICA|nr:hypothetical protein GOP47_0016847 [Adiantum capillus-veneris]
MAVIDFSAHLHHDVAPHVLVVPFPAQGHTNPALSVAKFLADNGISITLVQACNGLLPQIPSHSVHGNHTAAADQALQIFRKETIPSGLDHSKPFSGAVLKVSINVMRDALKELLQRLMLGENPPICLLIDSFFGWGNDIAAEFGLSRDRVDLWTSSAAAFYLGIHVQDLVASGFIPATEEGAKEKIVDFLPGLSAFRIADMPKNLIAEEGLQSDMFIHFRSVI